MYVIDALEDGEMNQSEILESQGFMKKSRKKRLKKLLALRPI
jgi:hypothetical protein